MFMYKNIKITLEENKRKIIQYEIFYTKCAPKELKNYVTDNLDVTQYDSSYKNITVHGGRKSKINYIHIEIPWSSIVVKGRSNTNSLKDLETIYYTDYFTVNEGILGIRIKTHELKFKGFEIEELLDILTYSADNIISYLKALVDDSYEIILDLDKEADLMTSCEAHDYVLSKYMTSSEYINKLQEYRLDAIEIKESEKVNLGTELNWTKLDIIGRKYYKREDFLFNGKSNPEEFAKALDSCYYTVSEDKKNMLILKVTNYDNIISQDIVEDILGHLYYYRFF